jgi:uncharacterized protein YndB with AHSA1/START domain
VSEVHIADELRLDAPIDVVWRAIADPAAHAGWHPFVTAIEEDSTGFGRMVSGWRSGFSVAERDGATIVTAHSTFRPKNLVVRAMLPVIRRKFHQTQHAILRGLREAVEGDRAARAA